MAYVFAPTGPGAVLARFFFPKHGAIVEDPGTGSACANLGGWWLAAGKPLPVALAISQGESVDKPCRLFLAVDRQRTIRVSGDVIELGRGEIRLP
jgi:predicted PhzF superfamily epimerase YddE/YHI9